MDLLSWTHFNEEHERCFHFLSESVKRSQAKHIIVATHHVPSFELMSGVFKGSVLNGAFAVELGNFIAGILFDQLEKKQRQEESIRKMQADGIPMYKIADYLGLSLYQLKKITGNLPDRKRQAD